MTLWHYYTFAVVNAILKPARSEDPLGFLAWVAKWTGERMAERAALAFRFKEQHPLTPYAKSLLEEQMALCATTRYDFEKTGADEYVCTNVETKKQHAVHLCDSYTRCVCPTWIEHKVPCRHARSVMMNLHINPLTPQNVRKFWPAWARSNDYYQAYKSAGVRYVCFHFLHFLTLTLAQTFGIFGDTFSKV
jgi:hypothetical protein